MVQCCICGLSNKDNLSLFSVPKDSSLRELWSTILGDATKILQENDCLCENHFHPSDVIKYLEVNDVPEIIEEKIGNSHKELIQKIDQIRIPNKRIRLRKGCLPIPCLKKIDLDVDIKEETMLDIKDEPEFIDTDAFLQETNDIKQVFVDTQFHSEDTGYFFDNIFDTNSLLGLADYWGIHSCDPNKTKVKPCMALLTEPKPRSILFSQMNVHQGVPVLEKQVILSENLELQYFARQCPVLHPNLPKICGNSEELQAAINEFSNFRLCRGGPHCKEYNEMTSVISCAYKDYSSMSWRHKYCYNIAVDGLETCPHCISLSKYLKVAQKKSKTLKLLKNTLSSDVKKWDRSLPTAKRKRNKANY